MTENSSLQKHLLYAAAKAFSVKKNLASLVFPELTKIKTRKNKINAHLRQLPNRWPYVMSVVNLLLVGFHQAPPCNPLTLGIFVIDFHGHSLEVRKWSVKGIKKLPEGCGP